MSVYVHEHPAVAAHSQRPTRIFGDNMPSVQMSNGGSVTRARHIARRVHIINEYVRDGEFVFQHVTDVNNPADFLGKWVPPKKFRATVKFIFNLDNAVNK